MHQKQGNERVGFILKNKDIVEVVNISPEPDESFIVRGEDILEYVINGDAIATWHTHPKKDANLTMADHQMFINYAELKHYIIGTDGVRCYAVKDGVVFNA